MGTSKEILIDEINELKQQRQDIIAYIQGAKESTTLDNVADFCDRLLKQIKNKRGKLK